MITGRLKWLSVAVDGKHSRSESISNVPAPITLYFMGHVTEMESNDDLGPLLGRAKRLDAEAFGQIVDRYSARLYGFLYRLTGSREEAEDLVQEVFVRMVRTIGTYEHRGRFEAWLFRIAANIARDRARRIKRAPKFVSVESAGEAERLAGPAWDRADETARAPDERVLTVEQVERVEQLLMRLPEPERATVLLRHYGEVSFAEIAEIMGTPLGTALARAHRGLAKLRNWMEQGS